MLIDSVEAVYPKTGFSLNGYGTRAQSHTHTTAYQPFLLELFTCLWRRCLISMIFVCTHGQNTTNLMKSAQLMLQLVFGEIAGVGGRGGTKQTSLFYSYQKQINFCILRWLLTHTSKLMTHVLQPRCSPHCIQQRINFCILIHTCMLIKHVLQPHCSSSHCIQEAYTRMTPGQNRDYTLVFSQRHLWIQLR